MQSYTQIFNTLRHVLKLYSQQCTRNSTALSLTPIQCPSGSKRQVKAVRLQRHRRLITELRRRYLSFLSLHIYQLPRPVVVVGLYSSPTKDL